MKKISLALTTAALFVACGSDASHIHTLEVAEFETAVEQQQLPLVDVRTADEYAEGHLNGAINIDVNQPDFIDKAALLTESKVAVYCLRGSRSLKAASQLAKHGVEVYNLAGGINAWKDAGKPITQDTP